MALKMGAPIVGLQDSGDARVEEGVAIFLRLQEK